MPAANLPTDTDTLDLTPCNPPLQNPLNVGCFRTGDGMRGNQNPFIASLQSIVLRRHNQHAVGLSMVNPHWDDNRLYEEARLVDNFSLNNIELTTFSCRRLTIAEVTKIHYGEYIVSLLGERLAKYFHLPPRPHGFTKYNPHVEPLSIQAVGVAAMRIGHSQTRSISHMIPGREDSYPVKSTFMLKDKFFNMIDVWLGQVNPVLRGMMVDSAKNIDPYAVTDLKDFLFFNPRTPAIVDLLSININRGRDHGVPSYVYYVQLCHGHEIHSWKDFERLMPATKVKSLRKVYR